MLNITLLLLLVFPPFTMKYLFSWDPGWRGRRKKRGKPRGKWQEHTLLHGLRRRFVAGLLFPKICLKLTFVAFRAKLVCYTLDLAYVQALLHDNIINNNSKLYFACRLSPRRRRGRGPPTTTHPLNFALGRREKVCTSCAVRGGGGGGRGCVISKKAPGEEEEGESIFSRQKSLSSLCSSSSFLFQGRGLGDNGN